MKSLNRTPQQCQPCDTFKTHQQKVIQEERLSMNVPWVTPWTLVLAKPTHYCYLDFETKSEEELDPRKGGVGPYKYSVHPSTDVLCVSFKIVPIIRNPAEEHSEPATLLTPDDLSFDWTEEVDQLYYAAKNPNFVFVAHNAFFEQNIWQNIMVARYGFPAIEGNRWKDTMAKALAHSLPGSLDMAGKILKLKNQKMQTGKELLKKLSRPRKKAGEPWWTPETAPKEFQDLYEYCCQDVETMIELDHTLRDLHPREQIVWQIDQRVNLEGLRIDLELVNKARGFEAQVKEMFLEQFRKLTGLNSPNQAAKVREFLLKEYAVAMPDFKAPTVEKFLEMELPQDAKTILIARQITSKTSLAKFKTMLAMACDGIVRGSFKYHGAHTGRWSGQGWQPQNLLRPLVDVGTACSLILSCDFDDWVFLCPDFMDSLGATVRGSVVPYVGDRFLGGDLAQMEARITHWVAGDEKALDQFRQDDVEKKTDSYCRTASAIYGFEVTKKMPQRQTGKVSVLSNGYEGGIGAAAKMAVAYRVNLAVVYDDLWNGATIEEREAAKKSWVRHYKKSGGFPGMSEKAGLAADIIKQRFRKQNPLIVKFWRDVNDAACRAVITRQPQKCGKLTWFVHSRFLYCKLPSGRCLAYPYPQVKESGYGRLTLSYLTPKMTRESTYGGKLTENIVQAIQRDLLIEAMIRLEKTWIYRVILHVHDELASSVPEGQGSREEYETLMKVVEPHHAGIPVNVSGWEGLRFGKA